MRIQGDFPVLQQVTPFPELGTADAFAAVGIDQIRCCGLRKTVSNDCGRFGNPGLEMQAQDLQSLLKALVHLGISLPALTGWIGPDQGIGESAGMQHGATSARAPYQIQVAGGGELSPLLGRGPLVAP